MVRSESRSSGKVGKGVGFGEVSVGASQTAGEREAEVEVPNGERVRYHQWSMKQTTRLRHE